MCVCVSVLAGGLFEFLLEDVERHHHRHTEQVRYLDLLPQVAMATARHQAQVLQREEEEEEERT